MGGDDGILGDDGWYGGDGCGDGGSGADIGGDDALGGGDLAISDTGVDECGNKAESADDVRNGKTV